MNSKKIITLSMAGLLSSMALVGCSSKDGDLAKDLANSINLGDAYQQPETGYLVPKFVRDIESGNKYDITWSEKSDFINVNDFDDNFFKVEVIRPAKGQNDASYTLTGTVKVGKKSANQKFEGIIPAYTEDVHQFVKGLEFVNFCKTAKADDKAELTGVVCHTSGTGNWLKCEDGHIVFTETTDPTIKLGDKVKFVGKPQMKDGNLAEIYKDAQVEIISRNNEHALPVLSEDVQTPADIVALDSTADHTIHAKTFDIKGVLSVDKSGRYDEYNLRDIKDPSKYVNFTFKSLSDEWIDTFKENKGKVATFHALYYYNSDHGTKIMYTDPTFPTCAALSEEEFYDYTFGKFDVEETLVTKLSNEFAFKDQANADKKATVSYVSEPEGLVKADGTVDLSQGYKKLTKLEATLKYNDGSKDIIRKKTFTNCSVGIEKYTTLADIEKDTHGNEFFAKVNIVYGVGSWAIAEQDGVYYVIDSYGIKRPATGKVVTLQLTNGYKNGIYALKNAGNLLTEDPTTPIASLDKSKAVAVNQAAAAAALKGGIAPDAVLTTEGLAEYNEATKNKTLVKVEGKVVEYKDGSKTKKAISAVSFDDGKYYRVKADFNTQLKNRNKDTEVVMYGIIMGGYSHYGDPVNAYQFLPLIVEDKVAA